MQKCVYVLLVGFCCWVNHLVLRCLLLDIVKAGMHVVMIGFTIRYHTTFDPWMALIYIHGSIKVGRLQLFELIQPSHALI